MDSISTKPPRSEGDPEAEAAKAADAAYASMLTLLSTNKVDVHDHTHALDGKPWCTVTNKVTDRPEHPPTRTRLICRRHRPTSERRPYHAVFLRFEWGHSENPLAVLELWFKKGAWSLVRTTDPELVHWPALEKLKELAGGELLRDEPLAISHDVVAQVAAWLVRTFKHHRALEAIIGLGPRD